MDTATLFNWETQAIIPNLRAWPAVLGFLGYDPRPPGQTTGEKLRRHRVGLGLSLREAGRLLGVDPSTLWKWELAKRKPQGKHLDLVVEFLKP